MPELKRTFSKARMNKDLDERLVPVGEYRDANNIEISTSEGSNVGTVQNLKGNTEKTTSDTSAGSSSSGTHQFNISYGLGPTCVGTVKDEANNKIYSFIKDGSWYRAEDSILDTNHLLIKSDFILEYDVATDTEKYVFNDIYAVQTTTSQNVSEGNVITVTSNQGVRPGMNVVVSGVNDANPVKVKHVFADDDGTAPEVISTVKVFLEENIPAHDGSSTAKRVTFTADRVLNFGFISGDRKITGINKLDDFLFWTDNENEPKKISISRSLAGTGGSTHLPTDLKTNHAGANRTFHTRLYTELDTFDKIECVTNAAGDMPIYVQEEHITVIKKAPTTPPVLDMSASGFNRKNTNTGADNPFSGNANIKFSDADSDLLKVGDKITATVNINVDWRDGDIILATKNEPVNPNLIRDASIRLKVDGSGENNAVTSPNTLTAGPYTLEIISIADDTPIESTTWWLALQTKDPLFEFKFVRFAYRYKYTDGEYSPFSPFSETAFIPAPYQYKAIDGYNLGMVNQLRGLKIKNYLPKLEERPEDIVAVDILFKDEVSPNVYTVKTINRQDGKSEGLELTWPDLSILSNARGELEITSEMIHAVVASNQLIRPYDNVPRKALAQEIIGSRIVYGNYVQGYDIKNESGLIKPEFNLSYKSEEIKDNISSEYSEFLTLETQGTAIVQTEPKKSVKSLRTYQVGVVYCDEFGRETPVLTDKATGSITVKKQDSDRKNTLQVSMKTDPPSWASHYKYFVKEISDKYHNLAMDRWYDAEDGNVYISFPSSERNKVDEETYLVLKKAAGSNNSVKEKARYKVLAIENEAPDYIKINKSNLGEIRSSSASNYTNTDDYPSHAGDGYPLIDAQVFKLDAQAIEARFGTEIASENSVLIKLANDDKLFVRFITSTGDKASEAYKVIKIAKDATANSISSHFYEFSIDSIFGDDISFLGTSGNSIDHQIKFEKHESQNSPEFDSRFFVKIAQDQALQDNVLNKTTEDNYLIKHTVPISYASSNLNFSNQYVTNSETDPGTIFGGSLGAPSISDSTGNRNGSPPDNYFFYDQSEWSDDAGIESQHNNGVFNKEGEGNYIGTPFIDAYTSAVAIPLSDFCSRKEDFFTGDILGNWCIDNENAIVGGAGRGVHKDNQGFSAENIYTVSGTDFYTEDFGRITTNDQARVLKDAQFNKLSQNGRDSSGNNNANTYPDDIYAEEYHNVMHLSFFGIKNSTANSNETSILGNLELEGQWDFTNAISTVGTLFRWQDDPDGTIYEITRVYEQTGIYNYASSGADTSAANKRVRYEIKFKHHVSGEAHGFGHGTPNRFHPLVNAVDASGNAVVTVPGHSIIKNAAGTQKEPFNYAGLAPNASNFLNLQIVEPFYVSDTDEKNSNPNPAIFETEPKESADLDIYFEASSSYPIEITEETNEMLIPIGSFFIIRAGDYGDGSHVTAKPTELSDTKYTITGFTNDQTFSFSGVNQNDNDAGLVAGLDDGRHIDITTPHGSIIQVVLNGAASTNAKSITIHGSPTGIFAPHNSKIGLPFTNCISFGNGVESDTIRDDFNAPTLANGVKASSVLAERYREERRKNGLIYSGIYNSQSGVNRLNQFIAGEKITKDVNPEYGSIQKIYARNGDLLTLCEDRVLKVLASNKDALFNADGNPQLISSTNVLGQAIPFPGEYGISTNPESFASYANNVYFTDATRGVVMQIKGDGMAPISEVGMSDYFSDELKKNTLFTCLGNYDEKKLDYNLTIQHRTVGVVDILYGTPSYKTITWSEKSGGWTSFKSYHPEQGISINNKYYTWKNGSMWEHHTNETHNSFYGAITGVTLAPITSSTTVQLKGQLNRVEPDMIVTGTGISAEVTVTEVNLNTSPGLTLITLSSAQTISADVTLTFAAISSITPIFNDSPSSVKSFGTLNYEGSQAKVVENDETGEGEYYNIDAKAGWYCESINTNKQEGQVFEFIEKEGKWFNNIYGVTTTLSNLDASERSVEGIGVPSAEAYSGTGNFTYTFTDKTDDALANVTFQNVANPLTVSGSSALNSQFASGINVFVILPDDGYTITAQDIKINQGSGSEGVTDDSPSSGDRTIEINEVGDGSSDTNTLIEKVEFSDRTLTNGYNAVDVKVFFNAVTPTTDKTITFDFD